MVSMMRGTLWKIMTVVQLMCSVMGSPVRIPDYSYAVYAIDDCPQNASQWDLASDRLNCSKAPSTKHRYHCMPDIRKDRLLEFCYPKSHIKMTAGYCIVLFGGGAISKSPSTNCSLFVNNSCPEEFYYSNQMYKYPGCLSINSMNSCYGYDPSCPPDVERKSAMSDDNVITITVLIIAGLLIIGSILLTCWCKRQRIFQLWNGFHGNQHGTEETMGLIQTGNENKRQAKVRDFLEEWQSDDAKYYSGINAVQELEERLLKHNIIMVVGGPGLGKTSLIRHVALKWHKERRKEMDKELESWKIIVVSTFEELNNAYAAHEDSKDLQIYVFDDPIGIHALNKQRLSSLFALYNNENLFTKRTTTKLLLTCRRIVYEEAKQSMPKIESFVLDIESERNRITGENRKQIFLKYCDKKDYHIIESCPDLLYPLLCRLYVNRREQNIFEFFSKPFHCLQVEFENMINQDCLMYSALVYCMLNRGEIPSEESQTNDTITSVNYVGYECGLNDIYKKLETAKGTYLKISESKYRFIHDYMWESLAIHFGASRSDVILEKMDSNFILKYVKMKDMEIPENKDTEIQGCIVLPDSHMGLLAKRMFEDVKQFHFNVFKHSCWRAQSFQREFVAYLDSAQYEDICRTFLDAQGINEVPKNGKDVTKSVRLESGTIEWYLQELLWNKIYKLESQFSCDIRPLRWIVANALTFLLEYFVSKNTKSSDDTSRIFGQDEEQTLLLVLACFSRDRSVVECVFSNIQNKENINRSCISENVEEKFNPHREFTPLAAACHANCPQIVQYLIEQNVKVYFSTDTDKSSLLYQSLSFQKYQICLLLIDGGADVNIKDEKERTLLHISASKGEGAVPVMESLIWKGVDVNEKDTDGKTPIFYAFERETGLLLKARRENKMDNNLEYFKCTIALLKQGAKPNLWDACHKSPVYTLFERERNCPDILQMLVDYGLDVNFVDKNDASLLHYAVLSADKSLVECVLKAKSPVDVDLQDKTGRSAVYKAAEKGTLDITELLIDHKADVNLPDKKKLTPLYQAVNRGIAQMVNLLVENGAMVNEKYEKKKNATPLHIAAKKGHVEISEYLLQKGALSVVDNRNKSPRDVATDEGHYELEDMLK